MNSVKAPESSGRTSVVSELGKLIEDLALFSPEILERHPRASEVLRQLDVLQSEVRTLHTAVMHAETRKATVVDCVPTQVLVLLIGGL